MIVGPGWLFVALLAAGIAAFSLVPGVGVLVVDEPPSTQVRLDAPPLVEADAAVEARPVTVATVSPARGARQVRRNALRVRNTGCEGVPTGAGFALDPMVLLADRDVLPGAGPLKVAASAGVPRAVEAARVYRLGDFGIARVGSTLPGRMPAGDVDLGESVAVVGYPLTPTPRLLPGIVVDRISGSPFGVRGEVVRLSSVLAHGDPGGPVLDAGGRLVGVAFTTDPRTGFAVAVPLATLRSLVARQALEALPACAGA